VRVVLDYGAEGSEELIDGVPLEQGQNVGIQHEETHRAFGSSIGIILDFLAVLGY